MYEALWLLTDLGIYACFAEGKVWQVSPLVGAGKVYRAKVERLSEALGGAFVDLGEAKALLRTDKRYQVGDVIVVQETEPPLPPKLAVVSDRFGFAGRYAVYLPNECGVRFSRRLPETARAAIADWPWPNGGWLVRTGVQNSDKDSAMAEAQALLAQYQEMGKGIGLLFVPEVDYVSLLAKASTALCNDEGLCRQTGATYVPDLGQRWQTIWRAEGAEGRVATSEGVELTFDHTEAAWVVDVDSGRYLPACSPKEAALAVNRIAAKEVVRQLGLRNLSGAIIVDFVSVPASYGKALVEYLKELAATYDPRLHVLDYTALGMIEMTRER